MEKTCALHPQLYAVRLDRGLEPGLLSERDPVPQIVVFRERAARLALVEGLRALCIRH